jgi:hypothetical protein
MATNEVLKICHRCKSVTHVPIDSLDRQGQRDVVCEKCKTLSQVSASPFEPSQFHAVFGDLRNKPTPEQWVRYMPTEMYRARRRSGERILGPPAIEIV